MSKPGVLIVAGLLMFIVGTLGALDPLLILRWALKLGLR
jgi:hypothetical protein